MFLKIRRIAKSQINIFFMCSMVLFFSCKDSYTSAIKVEYSGQELFEGIIFGVGPAAKHLPCLTSITKVEDLLEESDPIYKEFIAIKYLLLQTLEDDNINFFSDFKRGIQSGDHLTIQETLNMASVKYREVIIKISGLNDNELNTTANSLVKKYDLLDKEGKYSKENLKNAIRSLNNTENGKKSADACLYVAIAAVVILVLVIAQVAVAYFQWTYAAQANSIVADDENRVGSKGSLFNDQLINEIAINLRN